MMVKHESILSNSLILLSIGMLLLAGCASVPLNMSSNDISQIKNIAIETDPQDDGVCVLDIGGVRKQAYSKQYGGAMFGALGGLIEAAIIEGVASHKIDSMIGGNIAPIRESVADFNARSAFDDIFYNSFFQQMKEHSSIKNIIMANTNNIAATKNNIDVTTSDQKDSQSDTLLKIEYKYGIGAFVEKKPLPAVIARVTVTRLAENKKLMSNTIITYSCEANDYTLDDYAANHGEIYKQCFKEIADKLGRRLAVSYFGARETANFPFIEGRNSWAGFEKGK